MYYTNLRCCEGAGAGRDTYGNLRRAGNGQDIIALSEHPRERDLSGRRVMLLRNGLDPVDDLEYLGEVLLREAWQVAALVGRLEVVRRILPYRVS